MDRKTLRKLIKRLSIGRVDPGAEAAARRRALDDLYSAGIPTDEAASLSEEELDRKPPHTLLAWGRDVGPSVDLYVIPDSAIDARMRNDLDAINDLHFETPYDCSLFQLGAALRVLAATGLVSQDPEQFYEQQVLPVFEEMMGDRDAGELPGPEAIAGLYGKLRPYHVGRDAFVSGALDTRFSHLIAARQAD